MLPAIASNTTSCLLSVSNSSRFPAAGAGPISSGSAGTFTVKGGSLSYRGLFAVAAESRMTVTNPFCLSNAITRPCSTLPKSLHPRVNSAGAQARSSANTLLLIAMVRSFLSLFLVCMSGIRFIGRPLGAFIAHAFEEGNQDIERDRRDYAENQDGRCPVGKWLDGRRHARKKFHNDRNATTYNRKTEKDPDTITFDVLGGNRADLRPDRRAAQHNESRDQLNPPFVTVGSRAVKPGNRHIEQVRADGYMRRNSNQVNQRRHHDQAAADAQDAG